jgi:hypothetical protein
MMKKAPGQVRVVQGPQPRDFLRVPKAGQGPLNSHGKAKGPAPRISGKHALNPPIVTIIGAGVSGLSAAHELVERGFIVQIVDSTEDKYCPGRPIVGGMAANQQARVRPNLEDVHAALMAKALDAEDTSEKRVAEWLIKMFAFNRSRWIQTEAPVRINGCIYSLPDAAPGFTKGLLESLTRARSAYRKRWLWDLIVRGVKLGAITFEKEESRALTLGIAVRQFARLAAIEDTLTLARELLKYRINVTKKDEGLPWGPDQGDDLETCKDMVVAALEREFLSFRLVPFAKEGFDVAPGKARALYEKWAAHINSQPQLKHSCRSEPGSAEITGVKRGNAPEGFTALAWLNVEIIEQRIPGEHGYRFFPSFYRHLDDTMKRTPLFDNDGVPTNRTAADNLIPTIFQGVGLRTAPPPPDAPNTPWNNADPDPCPPKGPEAQAQVVELRRNRPTSIEGFRDRTDRFVRRLGGTQRDAVSLLAKFIRYMTTSPERRRKEYEGKTWAEFLGLDDAKSNLKFSDAMKSQIQSAAQALLAFSAKEGDARTYGNIALQMLLDELGDGAKVDRTLNGPTSDAWIEPWREYLEHQGVRFFCRRLEKLEVVDGELVPIFGDLEPEPTEAPEGASAAEPDPTRNTIAQNAYGFLDHTGDASLRPDFYVLALDLKQAAAMVKDHAERPDAADFSALAAFRTGVDPHGEFVGALRNMTGVQYFFDAKSNIGRGHMYFPYSPWGLSSISQSEFWSARGGFSDGYLGVLSVDVCTTNNEGEDVTFLQRLTEPEGGVGDAGGELRRLSVGQEAWGQIRTRIDEKFPLSTPRCFHVDKNMRLDGSNATEFLASVVGLPERPGRCPDVGCVGPGEIEYHLNAKRWVVAGTFMATHTRMTTMEAANESARHAVKAILTKLAEDNAAPDLHGVAEDQEVQIENLANRDFNWASSTRTYDVPITWNPEDYEMDDMDMFRRVDKRLLALGLPHFLDIIDFDRKLGHALDAVEIYGGGKLTEFLGLNVSTLDSLFVKELGKGYFSDPNAPWEKGKASIEKLKDALPLPLFDDMKGLLARYQSFFRSF